MISDFWIQKFSNESYEPQGYNSEFPYVGRGLQAVVSTVEQIISSNETIDTSEERKQEIHKHVSLTINEFLSQANFPDREDLEQVLVTGIYKSEATGGRRWSSRMIKEYIRDNIQSTIEKINIEDKMKTSWVGVSWSSSMPLLFPWVTSPKDPILEKLGI